MAFNHVLWEDVDGRVQAYPPLPNGSVLTDYTGFKGVARNSFVRICNVAAADLEDWELFDAQRFFDEEMDSARFTHEEKCDEEARKR